VTRVGILGLGTVGSAVARRLIDGVPASQPALSLTHIFDRRALQKRAQFAPYATSAASVTFTDCIDEVLRSDVDVVVETIGGVDPAAGWIRAALLAGKSVVTANKQVVAHHGASLWRLAARQGRQLRFEAAVGGAMPIVRAIGDGLAGDRITRIDAILNGTTNAVLSLMESTGCSSEQALDAARARGFAEADPRADLDGDDAAAKLAILCALAFGLRVNPAEIARQSTAPITRQEIVDARQRGGAIRQLAHAEYDYPGRRLTAWVGPVLVPNASIFARTTGADNAALIRGEHCGEVGIFGAGAGGSATAVAVVSDIAAIARDRAAVVPAPTLSSTFSFVPSSFSLLTSSFSILEAV
jgi:homoserine dehydrogenase